MQKNKKPKVIKKISEQRLKNIALHYMERFGGTEKSLRDVLARRVYKSMAEHPEQDMAEIHSWIEGIVKTAKHLGYINDSYFAKMRVQSLLRRGDSKKMITMKLKQKGITSTDIENAFFDLDDDSELQSAISYAKKRRFGVYGVKNIECPDVFNKQMASLARRGFSYSVAKMALLGQEQ